MNIEQGHQCHKCHLFCETCTVEVLAVKQMSKLMCQNEALSVLLSLLETLVWAEHGGFFSGNIAIFVNLVIFVELLNTQIANVLMKTCHQR